MSARAAGVAIDKAALREVFVIEARECLHDMRQALRALQTRREDGSEVEGLYRRARVIAGNAPSVGLHAAADLAHALQVVLLGVRAKTLPLTEVLLATLRCSVDRLREMLRLYLID